MLRLLKDISTIRSGYLFREKIVPDSNGQYQVIQIGDISTDGRLASGKLTRISLPEAKSSHTVKIGDVLFISRGQRKQALTITEELDNAIPTSQIFVIRPAQSLQPEYLAWYLNQRPAQRYVEEHSTGSNFSLINMEALGKMPIQLPPVETQRRMVLIHQLSLRERELMTLIQHKRHSLVELSLLKKIRAGAGA